jgi:hypothetical protein
MRQIAVLPAPDNTDLIGETAVEKVVGFPDAGDDDTCANAYRLSTAAAGHDDKILVILDERDLEGRTETLGGSIEHGVRLQDTFMCGGFGVTFWAVGRRDRHLIRTLPIDRHDPFLIGPLDNGYEVIGGQSARTLRQADIAPRHLPTGLDFVPQLPDELDDLG